MKSRPQCSTTPHPQTTPGPPWG